VVYLPSEDDDRVIFFDPKFCRLGNPNLVLFHSSRFLILPRSEVVVDEDGIVAVDQEMLSSAFDVTPDLPPRVLGSAWKHHIVFKTEIDLKWAVDIARSCELSAKEIVDKFMEV
jgi:hypothetical protein